MELRSIKQLKKKDLAGKRVFVRVDWNVPIKNGKIMDTYRIDQSFPTLLYLASGGATLVLATHLGDEKASIDPIVEYVSENLPYGNLIFLPNLRSNPGEEKNDKTFAKQLAKEADIYVNEAFAVCHRKHASVVSLPKLLPAYAGLLVEKEVRELSKAFKPKHPFVFVLGGVKFSTKLPLIKRFAKLADTVFVGGALANSLFLKEGYEVGKSVVDREAKGLAEILKYKNVVLPIDVVTSGGKGNLIKMPEATGKQEKIVDIGPQSVAYVADKVSKAKLVVWNGPQGNFEAGYGQATADIAKAIAKSKAYSIIGGGDTVTAIEGLHINDQIYFISTGGGAMLEFLAQGTLPGLEVLEK